MDVEEEEDDDDDDEVDVEEEEEEDDDVEGEDVEEEDRSQDQEAHFVRACAGETHMDHWEEPLRVEICRKNTGPQSRDTFCASVRRRNAHGPLGRAILWKFTGQMPDLNPATHVLCEPAQAKRTWTLEKSHFVWKFTGKTHPTAIDNGNSNPQ